MVMWQVLIGRTPKRWYDQLFGPVRGSAVHGFLFRKKRGDGDDEGHTFKTPDILVKDLTTLSFKFRHKRPCDLLTFISHTHLI